MILWHFFSCTYNHTLFVVNPVKMLAVQIVTKFWLSWASRRKSLLLIPEQWTTPHYIVLDSGWQFHAVSLLLRLASCSHANPISGRQREVRGDTAATCRQMSVSLQAPGIRRAASGCRAALRLRKCFSPWSNDSVSTDCTHLQRDFLSLICYTFTLVLAKEMIPRAWDDDLCFFSI